MWIATGNKLIKYDTSGKRIKTYLLYDIKGKPSWMAGFCESRQKQILITIGKGGIYCYDKNWIPSNNMLSLQSAETSPLFSRTGHTTTSG